jgi:hypothetical protein
VSSNYPSDVFVVFYVFNTNCSLLSSSYFGLVSFWIGRVEGDNNWVAHGVKAKDTFATLAGSVSPWNFQNSELILLCTRVNFRHQTLIVSFRCSFSPIRIISSSS